MYPGFALPENTQFVPMIFGGMQVNREDPEAAIRAGQSSGCIMGFNEPDGHTADQSGLAAMHAVQLWPQIHDAAQSARLRLESPAMGGDAAKENCWLDEYRQKTQVNFICVHSR